jgi:hypothetical protein
MRILRRIPKLEIQELEDIRAKANSFRAGFGISEKGILWQWHPCTLAFGFPSLRQGKR